MENIFTNKIKEKKLEEIYEILDNIDKYQQSLIVAAITELENRDIEIDKYVELRERILKTQEKREELSKNKFKIPKDMPNSIRRAAHLMFISLIIGMLSIIGIEMLFDAGIFRTLQMFIAIELTILISLIFTYFVLLGRSVARTLFLISYILGVISTIFNLVVALKILPIFIIIFPLVHLTLQFFALKFLYSKKSNEWYNKQKQLLVVGV